MARAPAHGARASRHTFIGELEAYEPVRLFVERARGHDPFFSLSPHNALTVAEICRRLEGIPLAIELAAARMGTLSLEQILERLEGSLKLLTRGGRTRVPRQQTLKGTLDWSHDLLSEPERVLFRRLSVFARGWTLEAAEAVGMGGGLAEDEVVELLSGLVEKSLVVAASGDQAGARYRLLEPIRQYAREKLEESGEAQEVRGRHAEYFLGLAKKAEMRFWGSDEAAWSERLEAEHDNLRAALIHTLEHGDANTTLRLTGALSWFWLTRGYVSEGTKWLDKALAAGGPYTTAARAGALLGLGDILKRSDIERSQACLEEALTLYDELGDRRRVAESLSRLGFLANIQRDVARATTLYEEG